MPERQNLWSVTLCIRSTLLSPASDANARTPPTFSRDSPKFCTICLDDARAALMAEVEHRPSCKSYAMRTVKQFPECLSGFRLGLNSGRI